MSRTKHRLCDAWCGLRTRYDMHIANAWLYIALCATATCCRTVWHVLQVKTGADRKIYSLIIESFTVTVLQDGVHLVILCIWKLQG